MHSATSCTDAIVASLGRPDAAVFLCRQLLGTRHRAHVRQVVWSFAVDAVSRHLGDTCGLPVHVGQVPLTRGKLRTRLRPPARLRVEPLDCLPRFDPRCLSTIKMFLMQMSCKGRHVCPCVIGIRSTLQFDAGLTGHTGHTSAPALAADTRNGEFPLEVGPASLSRVADALSGPRARIGVDAARADRGCTRGECRWAITFGTVRDRNGAGSAPVAQWDRARAF